MRRLFAGFAGTVPGAAAACLIAASVTITAPSHASPLELFGFGARSPGLAGGGVADANDYSSVYTNPAGLARVRHKGLAIGTAATRFRLAVNNRRKDIDNGTALIFGGAVPIPLGGALSERVVLGLGFHIPNQALVRVDRPLVGEPTFVLLDNRADSLAVQVALGVRITDRLSVGAGVLILAALAGKITVTNDAAGAFVSQSEQRLETDVAPIVGARYELRADLALGLAARAPSRSDYNIEIETDLTSIPLGLPELAVAGNAQYDPGMVALGAAYVADPRLTLFADLEYRRWSAFPRPTENPVIGGSPTPAPGFHDTVVPRLAAEATRDVGPATLRPRVGYAFFLSPAPQATGEATLLDNHRHMLSAGLGVSLDVGAVPMRFDLWTQVHLLHLRRHTKDSGAMRVSSKGQIVAGGLTAGVEL